MSHQNGKTKQSSQRRHDTREFDQEARCRNAWVVLGVRADPAIKAVRGTAALRHLAYKIDVDFIADADIDKNYIEHIFASRYRHQPFFSSLEGETG